MIKQLALGAGVAALVSVVGLLGYAATKPDNFRVERSVMINAPAAKIYPLVADFHNFPSWSPFEKLDPAMKRTHSGAASGKGAVYEWDGNGQAGQGRMEITAVEPPNKVLIALDFSKPFEAHNVTQYTLTPVDGGTRVTWSMFGPSPYLTKLMTTFFSMDSMVGKDFEAGLHAMKAIAEK